MKRISIERYKTPTNGYSGLIEGETDEGDRWIMYLDIHGRPEVFWPRRHDEDGSVTTLGLPLNMGEFGTVFRLLGVEADPDSDIPDLGMGNKVVTTFPKWEGGDEDGMRGLVFAVVPGETHPADAMRKFLKALSRAYAQDPLEQ